MVLVMGPDGLVPAPPMGAPPINASSPLALARRGGGATVSSRHSPMVLRGSRRLERRCQKARDFDVHADEHGEVGGFQVVFIARTRC